MGRPALELVVRMVCEIAEGTLKRSGLVARGWSRHATEQEGRKRI